MGALLCLLSPYGCEQKKADKGNTEGIIEYSISYQDDQAGRYSTSMLPKSMTTVFNENSYKNTIHGFLGFFSLVNITDVKELRNITILKLLDKQYTYVGGKNEGPCCFGEMNQMQVEFRDETKTIAGMPCKRARITISGNSIDAFDAYYTESIAIDNPNATSPFKDIKGVLMEFRVTLSYITLMLKAEKVTFQHVGPEEFKIPDNCRAVTKEEMQDLLNTLLE